MLFAKYPYSDYLGPMSLLSQLPGLWTPKQSTDLSSCPDSFRSEPGPGGPKSMAEHLGQGGKGADGYNRGWISDGKGKHTQLPWCLG